jgi:multidrug resistance protein
MRQRTEHGRQRSGGIIRSPVALMALTIFIDFTGFGLIIPLLPFWAERLGAGPQEIGLLLAAYAATQFVFTPILGALSDRLGRKPIILLSLVVEGIAFALTALAGSLALLFAARLVGGLGASNIGSAQAVVADATAPERRARAMGAIGAAIGLGFVVGPAAGGALAVLGPAVPFWVALGVAALNAVLVWRFLPETRSRARSVGEVAGQAASAAPVSARVSVFAGWSRALRHSAIRRLAAINLLYTVAFAGMEAVFVLLTQRTFGWTAEQNGYLFAYVGVIVVLMQGGLVGVLARWLGERRLLMVGLLLLAAGLVALPWSADLPTLLIALGAISIGDGAVTPALASLLSFAGPPDSQGETLGVAQGIAAMGRILGPTLMGSLFAVDAALPFVLGGSLPLVGVAIVIALPRLRFTRTPDGEPPVPPEDPSGRTSPGEEVARIAAQPPSGDIVAVAARPGGMSGGPIALSDPSERTPHPMSLLTSPSSPLRPASSAQHQPGHRRLRIGFAVLCGLLALAILVQVFLAGGGIFAGASWWPMHEVFGMGLTLGPLVLLALGIAARLPGRTIALTALALVLTVLQSALIEVPRALGLPLVAALHPVNALVIFALVALLGQQAIRSGIPMSRAV